MAFYRYHPDTNRYNGIALDEEDWWVRDLHFESRAVSSVWKPVPVIVFDAPRGEGDFPSLSTYSKIPVFSRRAWHALRPVIGLHVEALPIRHPAGGYFIINVLDLIDCLDEERSVVRRHEEGGRIYRVDSYCLKAQLLAGRHIFKTPLKSGAETLVDDVFREAVETHGLKGLVFAELPMRG